MKVILGRPKHEIPNTVNPPKKEINNEKPAGDVYNRSQNKEEVFLERLEVNRGEKETSKGKKISQNKELYKNHKGDNTKEEDQTKKTKGFQGGVVMLAEHPSCADDIQRLCHEVNQKDNFELLVCIQDKAKEDDVSKECHNLIWSYKKNLTCDAQFEAAAKKMCKSDLEKNLYCKKQGERRGHGHLIPCLLEYRQKISDSRCHHLMTKMQAAVFSNYHLIEGFFDKCYNDVVKNGCGRITEKEDEEDIHTQNEVLECLEDYQDKLTPACQKEIYRMAELSADDYHLDRPLYYACRDDHEKFCQKEPAGEGKVYKCLKKHKFEETMSKECRAALVVRQKIESKDYKAAYGLLKYCEADFEKYKKEYSCNVEGKSPHGSLAEVLLCLENAIYDDKAVDNQCQSELFEIRQQLMEDYKINPEIVVDCEVEITQHCSQGKEREGKTLDCLMKLAEEGQGKITKKCQKAVAELLKETNAGGDYRIDHTLYMACEPVVQTTCKDKGKKEGDVMVLSCLMEHLNSDTMNHECREQLLHLQFFIARDFRLDPDLYKVCKKDAKDFCHAPPWSEESDEMPSGMIMSCLYRNSGEGGQVSENCAQHVRRAMHQRALDVHLIPEVQESCMPDLAQHCSQNIEKGQEVECLQRHLEELRDKCRSVIGNFTEEEGEDYQLDQTLVLMCKGMITKFCQGDSEGVLACLIEHKNEPEMDEKCKVPIEQWQLIEMKDFRFSAKFKKACKDDMMKYCPKVTGKHTVIKCLSRVVWNAVIEERSPLISRKCHVELHAALRQEGENIHFDPELFGACKNDAKKLCSRVTAGQAKVVECLKDHYDFLEESCQEQIFEREKKDMQIPDIDFQLVKTCQQTLEHFCSDVEPSDLLKCLKKHKNEPKMDSKCRAMVTKRQKTQYKDYQLDPELQGACKREMRKFCKDKKKIKADHGDGKMVACLKKQIDRLSKECEIYIHSVMHEEALDYRLDPIFSHQCEREIVVFCGEIEPGNGRVKECLKNKVKKIPQSSKCFWEVIRTIKEGRSDISADPVLHEACKEDLLRYCEDVRPGSLRMVGCLMAIKKGNKHPLSKSCYSQLSTRIRLWNETKSLQVSFESFRGDELQPISESDSALYILIIAVSLTLVIISLLLLRKFLKRSKRNDYEYTKIEGEQDRKPYTFQHLKLPVFT